MAHTVLAVGAAVVTGAGSVWYLPALADLRAGGDRTRSCRGAAAACVSGWGTAGLVAVLLLLAGDWWVPGTAALTGALVTAGLRVRATVRRHEERREAARQWGELGRTRPPHAAGRSRHAVAALLAVGLAAVAVTAVYGMAAELS